MRVSDVKRLFHSITKQYFAGANVIFSNQSRAAKPALGLVVLIPGAARRPQYPNTVFLSGVPVSAYASRLNITVDLFTHGSPVLDPDTGETVGYENTATDDMLSFMDYLNSLFVGVWCHMNDITILTEGDVTDLTGAVNDTSYEYRARLSVVVYFTQYAVGAAGVLSESSIRYPVYELDLSTADLLLDQYGNPIPERDPDTGEILLDENGNPIQRVDPTTGMPVFDIDGNPVYERDPDTWEVLVDKDGNVVYKRDLSSAVFQKDEDGNPVIATDPETGEPVYTEYPPVEYRSPLSDTPDIGQDMIIEPLFIPTSTGGGSEELASEETGYFTEAEVKEEKA